MSCSSYTSGSTLSSPLYINPELRALSRQKIQIYLPEFIVDEELAEEEMKEAKEEMRKR